MDNAYDTRRISLVFKFPVPRPRVGMIRFIVSKIPEKKKSKELNLKWKVVK